MKVEITRKVVKHCPFKDEVDEGWVTITFNGHAPELHAFVKDIEGLTVKPISHEDFTQAVLKSHDRIIAVRSNWFTAGWDVEVTA